MSVLLKLSDAGRSLTDVTSHESSALQRLGELHHALDLLAAYGTPYPDPLGLEAL